MINSKNATAIALNDTSSHFVDWKLVEVTVLRCELVGERWEVDVRRVYLHGDLRHFPLWNFLWWHYQQLQLRFCRLAPTVSILRTRRRRLTCSVSSWLVSQAWKLWGTTNLPPFVKPCIRVFGLVSRIFFEGLTKGDRFNVGVQT